MKKRRRSSDKARLDRPGQPAQDEGSGGAASHSAGIASKFAKLESATIKDVARTAGLSTATVSYVLNGSKPVSQKTAMVKDALAACQYRPNQDAVRLATLAQH